jgi:hypothetical protein
MIEPYAALWLGALNHLKLRGAFRPNVRKASTGCPSYLRLMQEMPRRSRIEILDGSRCPHRIPICWSLRSAGGHHLRLRRGILTRAEQAAKACDIAWQRICGAFSCSVERPGTSIWRKSLCRSRSALLRLGQSGCLVSAQSASSVSSILPERGPDLGRWQLMSWPL